VPPTTGKDPAAFRTIGEVSAELGIAQHILRYWEGRFPQLKPLQRAGGRRYYRPDDVELLRRIHSLLSRQGYTVRGVQQLLKGKEPLPEPSPQEEDLLSALKRVRAELDAAIS
jgi:DNA-binding transcriptional MerR regulator